MRVLFCEGCGCPLDAPWAELVIVCPACGSQNMPGRPGGPVPARVPVDGRPRVNLGGRTYVLERELARGDSSAVYRGRWVVRLGEAVVVKILASRADEDLLRAEWRAIRALRDVSDHGASHFRTRLPAPIAHGLVDTGDGPPRVASVFGWKSGFVHTLAEVGDAHPGGVPRPIVVWILKRLLELLGFVHRAGFVHGAVTPDHVLIHPRDHGAILCGWTVAGPAGRPVPAVPARWAKLYPSRRATPGLDVAMACTCAHAIAGWHLADVVASGPIAEVLAAGRRGDVDDAWALADRLVAASAEELGPPSYHPLPMPGWS